MSTAASQATGLSTPGPQLIKATSAYAVEHRGLSWFYAISTALVLLAAWSSVLFAPNLLVAIPLSLLSALVMVRLFVIYHDFQHGAILRGSRLAKGFMAVVGWLLVTPSSVWRASHDYHHQNNSRLRSAHIGSFPVMTTEKWATASRGTRFCYRFIRHPLTIFFGYPLAFLFAMCLEPLLRNPRRHWDGLLALGLHAAVAVLLYQFGGWTAVILVQTVPATVSCAFGCYLFYAQHNSPGVRYFTNEGWTYLGAALESSSYCEMGRLMRWFTANIGYHHIHHLNARIPFYRLPEVMRAFPELQQPVTTSLRATDIYRCLRLALWDEERGRLVGYAQQRSSPAVELAPAA